MDVPIRSSAHPGERTAVPSDARELIAHCYRPAGPGPHPAVVVNHGSLLEQDSHPGIARTLTDAGFLVLVPWRRGYGGSPGPSRVDEVTAAVGTPEHGAQVCARLLAESDDVLAALQFVRARPDVDPTRTAVMGSSYGGINSLLAAARDPLVGACVAVSAAAMSWGPVPELRDLLLHHVDMIRCPVQFLQAENDFDLRPSAALTERCRTRGGVCERHLVPPFGANHFEAHRLWVYAPHVWAPVVLPFLARHLRGVP
ncbi:MAG TPA: alpha/beta fold hydrolase [bacterium]|nr:alpha/beta fold hydrolase [bacterium]